MRLILLPPSNNIHLIPIFPNRCGSSAPWAQRLASASPSQKPQWTPPTRRRNQRSKKKGERSEIKEMRMMKGERRYNHVILLCKYPGWPHTTPVAKIITQRERKERKREWQELINFLSHLCNFQEFSFCFCKFFQISRRGFVPYYLHLPLVGVIINLLILFYHTISYHQGIMENEGGQAITKTKW